MEIVDIILLILLGVGAVNGYQQGFIVEFFSFLAFFIGLFLALELTIPVSIKLFGESDFFEFATIIVFIVLFVLLSRVIKTGAKALKKVINIAFFGILDNLLGIGVGILKWSFMLSTIFWVFDSLGFEIRDQFADNSIIFPYIVDIGPEIFGWLSKTLPFIQDLIDSMEKMPHSKNTYVTFLADVFS